MPSLFGTFHIYYVLVVMEIGSRRIVHTGVTQHPTAAWTANQLRNVPADRAYKYLVHDNDSIFSAEVDAAAARIGLEALRTPPHSLKANAFCERLIGRMRRECLDWMLPFGENHLRSIVADRSAHYNRTLPHMVVGPGIPDPPPDLPAPRLEHRHRLPRNSRTTSTPILGGLHHEYRLERDAA